MMWRRMYCVLLCLVLCALYCFRSFADEYTLTEEDFMAPEGYPQAAQDDVNGWLSSVPDEDMDFDQYQQIMEILYPELLLLVLMLALLVLLMLDAQKRPRR